MYSLLRTGIRQFRCQNVYPAVFSKSFSVMGLKERKIELMVCDMAGTTVDEGGLVYVALRNSMNEHGLEVQMSEMDPWHGMQKGAVMEHFIKDRGMENADSLLVGIEKTFEDMLSAEYFAPDSPISLIHPNLADYFSNLRSNGIKVALNTGYPTKLQEAILDKLKMREICDEFICAYDCREGRPSPYMVYHLMERLGVKNCRAVVKVGDTVADIGEGLNSGCGYVVGVESGADDKETLLKAGAHDVFNDVTCIEL